MSLEYIIEGKVAVIVGATDEETDIVIPERIEELQVGKINDNAFVEHPNLRSIVIPKSVKVIGNYAFASCKKLTDVVLNEGLETIEDWAFISCEIDQINIPSTLKRVGENSFLGCVCRSQIKEFLNTKKAIRRLSPNKYAPVVLPFEALEYKEVLNINTLQNLKKYQQAQFEIYDEAPQFLPSLDLPFFFDGNSFLVVIGAKEKLEDFKFKTLDSTEVNFGNYNENDPDFILYELQIQSTNIVLGRVYFKIPYADSCTIDLVDTIYLSECVVLKFNISMSCYGNGNIDREFAVNQYDELKARYKTQFENQAIPEEVYLDIENRIADAAFEKTKQFISQLEGAPLMKYFLKLCGCIIDDEELNNKQEFLEFMSAKIDEYYNFLTDVESLQDVAFNMAPQLEYIIQFTGMTYEQLNARYNIYLEDRFGNEITIDRAMDYEEDFIDIEENYTTHGYILNEILSNMAQIEDYVNKTYLRIYLEAFLDAEIS